MVKAEDVPGGKVQETVRRKALVRADLERRWSKARKETLLDLANLQDDCCSRFWRRFRLQYLRRENDSVLLKFRDQLRKVWAGAPGAEDVVPNWMNQVGLCKQQSLLLWSGPASWIAPNYGLLPLSLAIGVTELRPKMAICANPECPQPYFLKGRVTQRYCDRPACVIYAQREHKKKWWRKKRGKGTGREKGPKRKR